MALRRLRFFKRRFRFLLMKGKIAPMAVALVLAGQTILSTQRGTFMRILQPLTLLAALGTSVPFGLAQDSGSFSSLYSFTGGLDATEWAIGNNLTPRMAAA